MSELMQPDVLYIMGPGSTIKAVMQKLGVEGSILGVDTIKDGNLQQTDLNEEELLAILEDQKKVKIVISPIGAQGYLFGRGNQQLSPEVIRKVGVENIMILATPMKLRETPVLRVDTGDRELDKELSGLRKVISGYHGMHMKKVE
jgi:predicted polyphosphate/ATP-dependent NAD kinase